MQQEGQFLLVNLRPHSWFISEEIPQYQMLPPDCQLNSFLLNEISTMFTTLPTNVLCTNLTTFCKCMLQRRVNRQNRPPLRFVSICSFLVYSRDIILDQVFPNLCKGEVIDIHLHTRSEKLEFIQWVNTILAAHKLRLSLVLLRHFL